MAKPRRLSWVFLSVATVAGLLAVAGPAQANDTPQPSCGDTVNYNIHLSGNIGPCSGNGLVIGADGLDIDLNGYSIIGQQDPDEDVGILLDGVSFVRVHNGTVRGFDAGVSVEGGARNTVENITARDNRNDLMEPFDPRLPLTFPELLQTICIYGDGITTFNSSRNTIQNNTVVGNGPYAGISLVENSDRNVVRNNTVRSNDVPNLGVTDGMGNPVYVSSTTGLHTTAGDPNAVLPSGMCGAADIGSPGMTRGRTIQDIGIRTEGPGADKSQILGNSVAKSALAGISVHSYVCMPIPNTPQVPEDPNTGTVITGNSVQTTGATTSNLDPFADGIAVLAQGPIGNVTCTSNGTTIDGNTSTRNFRNGISIGRTSTDNRVRSNTANGNGTDGFRVYANAVDNLLTYNAGRGNAEHDGHDSNPCNANKWANNTFGTFFILPGPPPCTAPAAAAAAAPPAEDSALVSHPARP